MKKTIKTNIIAVCTLSVISLLSINVSALDYQKTINVGFDIQESLTVSLSSPNLIISDLTPGASGNSNTVTVSVTTNNLSGYFLSATAGTSTTNTNLTNKTNNDYYFTSLATSASQPSVTVDNTWGYRYSSDAGTTWTNYSGLPLDADDDGETGAKLIDTDQAADSKSIDFQIGAKASDTQASGEYTNVVNFYAVSYSTPTYIMQDVASWKDSLKENEQIVTIDNRDNKQYYVAKLADGNIWMTQNLDHDIVTTTDFYTYTNTDIGHGSTPDTSATWTAIRSTYATNITTWCAGGTWMSEYNYCQSNYTPESYDPGNVCWDGVIDDSRSTDINTGTISCVTPDHYHIGNYYNWNAAVAMNDTSGYTSYTNIDQSICPAGWRLPAKQSTSNSDYYVLVIDTLNLTEESIQKSPVYFPYAGGWNGSSWSVGTYSGYLTSSISDSNSVYGLDFDYSYGIFPDHLLSRSGGYSVRCLAR